jgi:hypothetical protein
MAADGLGRNDRFAGLWHRHARFDIGGYRVNSNVVLIFDCGASDYRRLR